MHTNTYEIESTQNYSTVQNWVVGKARKAIMLHHACRQDQQAWLPATVLRTVRPGQKLHEECASRAGLGQAVDKQTHTEAWREILVVAYRPLGLC